MAALIAVEGGSNGPNGHALSDTTFEISLFLRENFDIFGAEMMLVSAACCMMADLYKPGADWVVEKCSVFL